LFFGLKKNYNLLTTPSLYAATSFGGEILTVELTHSLFSFC
jgi:hypothetical protein